MKRTKLRKLKLWSSDRTDIEFSHWIRDRDGKRCFFCKKKGSQNSHFWGRGASSTRYDPLNCDYSCGGCHMRNEGSKQGLYRELKIVQLGEQEYKELEKRARTLMQRSDAIKSLMELICKK